jgi:serine/threonine-protein kinase RsbW
VSSAIATQLRLLPFASELATAREFVDAAAERFGLDETRRYQFKLAVSEATANAIEHGSPLADGTLHLALIEDGDALTCTIRDAGRFTATPAEPEVLPDRGRGLAFMMALTDSVDFSHGDDGTVVSLTVRR